MSCLPSEGWCRSLLSTPFELLYGRNPKGPLDVIKEVWQEPLDARRVHYISPRHKLEAARDQVQKSEEVSKVKMKVCYDTRERD